MKDVKTLIISPSYGGEIEFLTRSGHAEYLRIDKKSQISNKRVNILNSFYYLYFLTKRVPFINQYDVILAIENNLAMSVLLLSKLRLLKAKKIIWWGIYLHSEKAMGIYRRIRFLFETKKTVYVLFSEFESALYQNIFGKKAVVKVFQFGDWSLAEPDLQAEADFYFSGGYSNRHYLPLIKAFEKSTRKLVIVASKLNKELINIETTKNIVIRFDLERDEFYNLLAKSKGVIIPLKNNTGASGQSVVLQAMRHRKLIVINDNGVMKEYVQDRFNGIVVKNIEEDLLERIEEIENDLGLKELYIENSHQTFQSKFSKEACIQKTLNILSEVQESVR